MSSLKTDKKSSGSLLVGIAVIIGTLSKILFKGLKIWLKSKNARAKTVMAVWLWFSLVIVLAQYKHLWFLHLIFPIFFSEWTIAQLLKIPWPLHVVFVFIVPTGFLSFVYGIRPYLKELDYNRRLNLLGLKTATGMTPKVVSIHDIDEHRKRIVVASQGIGIDQYKSRKNDLDSAFKTTVESIVPSKRNQSLVEIYTTARQIPKLVHYTECQSDLKSPMSFILGESRGGLLTQSLESLPHMMIAGTTGGGKSNFFKQSILSILKTTEHIQVYILDLKLGVEAKDFASLPNVRVAKDETEANSILAQVREEMKKRFEILEKRGTKKIDPEKDKKDIILIAVDESSVLYGKTKMSGAKSKMSNEARELTDDLAKLGRAARVHLILATQKVTTDTIDTKIQENIGGRICFRANTLQGSMQVLGNKMAYELPDIKGRAIWSNGTTFAEVQTPFVDDSTIENEIKLLKTKLTERKQITYEKLFSSQLEVINDDV